jgi:hypothetical protein
MSTEVKSIQAQNLQLGDSLGKKVSMVYTCNVGPSREIEVGFVGTVVGVHGDLVAVVVEGDDTGITSLYPRTVWFNTTHKQFLRIEEDPNVPESRADG